MTFSTYKPYKSILITLGSFFLLAAGVSTQTSARPIDQTFSNGDRFIGDVVNGKAIGCGIYINKGGNWYAGKYSNNKKTLGHYSWVNPNHHYFGNLLNDERHGYGIYYHSLTERYEGQWKNGNRDGYGVYYHNNGSKSAGRWSKGKLISTGTVSPHHLTQAISAAANSVNTCRVSW